MSMSDGLHAPSTFDSASDPDDAGNGPHAGGACCLSVAVLLGTECCYFPTHYVFYCCSASVNCDLVQGLVRASGGAGGNAAHPEHAPPATAAPAAEARRKADKRRPAAGDAAGSNDCDSEAPSEGRPSKRHRAAAAGASSGHEAVNARAALGAAEAEARSGEAVDAEDHGGDVRAAWACATRTRAMRLRWRMSAGTSSSRCAGHDFVRLCCIAGACSCTICCALE